MDYIEQDDSMPAFIRDIKAHNKKQIEYHYQHSASIRHLEEKNNQLEKRISELEVLIKRIIDINQAN